MTIQEQINQLDSVRRLLANDDFNKLFQSMLDDQLSLAHSNLLNPEITGSRLEFARARYCATRELANFLKNKETALEKAISEKQDAMASGFVKMIDSASL